MKTSILISTGVLAFASTLANAQKNYTASPIPTATSTGEACALVSSAWAAQSAATATPTIEASVAYDCLQSVPIDKDGALKFLDGVVPYMEWQSDHVYKKNPPAGYFYPPYDFWAELAKVRAGVEADTYPNEYAWQADFYLKVFGPGHDGHFVVYTDVLTTAIEWGRRLALVSISEDGSSLPVIKVYGDVISSPDTASVVKLINGIDAVTYISNFIYQAGSNQEPDSAYSSMFFSKAYNQLGTRGFFQSGGRVRYIYPGNATSLTFENGTELTLSNVGRIKGNWNGVTDGPSFFTRFAPNAGTATTATATPSATQTQTATSTTADPTTSSRALPTIVGYPEPVLITSDKVVSGYYLNGDGFADVAVLAMTSFDPENPPEFQKAIQDFFAEAKAAGKTKLILDVQTNGGGLIFQGYDTFRQIFPDIVQNGTGRWRRSSGFNATSELTSSLCADFDPLTADEDLILICDNVENWRYDLDVNDENFTSYEDKFGPLEYNGDEFTDVMQWNFSNPLDTINSTYGIGFDVTGYGSRKNFTRPFGGPENVVLLLDGYCASTCTIFAQFLKYDAGVKSIAMGGRPQAGLIQGVGGVKGSQSSSFSGISSLIDILKNRTNDPDLLAEFNRYGDYVYDRAPTLSLNVKDEIQPPNLSDGTPAQYIQEDADCRLYWTADMHTDITNLWKAVATAAFNGGKCAAGGIDATTTTKRTVPRPAPFSQPRFTLPKQIAPAVRSPVVKREVSDKVRQWFLEQQHMKVIE